MVIKPCLPVPYSTLPLAAFDTPPPLPHGSPPPPWACCVLLMLLIQFLSYSDRKYFGTVAGCGGGQGGYRKSEMYVSPPSSISELPRWKMIQLRLEELGKVSRDCWKITLCHVCACRAATTVPAVRVWAARARQHVCRGKASVEWERRQMLFRVAFQF